MLSEKRSSDDFTEINISDDISINGKNFIMMAGPCAAENRDQVMRTADGLAELGIKVFRAGCFKPRTDPYAFQGSGEEGLKWLVEVREQYGMKIISEVSNFTNFDTVKDYVDIIQIGAKSMYDHSLLIGSGKSGKPILIKRAFGATIDEYLRMTEYVLANGNRSVLLCERGIRTFETASRFTLDLCGAAVLQERVNLPLILDPSHAVGINTLVPKLAMACAAFDCDGLIIEVHCNPEQALCDKNQALSIEQYKMLYSKIKEIAVMNGRCII
ncbi:MAG: 3-deoxy-7-phosphoheptulonate synthase [Bacteroidales bacterium]|jgi:3-deoxy-7-phosphoheptulonate synthase|nr:3-deoxy-7-phosphoheptulonate synthase [Bacteroidales bacterium]